MKRIIITLLILSLYACSSTGEAQKSQEEKAAQDVYVFDSVSPTEDSLTAAKDSVPNVVPDTVNIERNLNSILKKNVKYFVQVGAFTTRARAERFVTLNKEKITFPMEITYNEKVKLFVVRLPFFRSREEAEKVRNALWKSDDFKDAFIVTVFE